MDTQNTQEEVRESGGSHQESSKSNLAMPIAIVLAGALIAFAIYNKAPDQPKKDAGTTGQQPTTQGNSPTVKPITDADHILGNPAAPVKMVEYSDMECPFCRRFHPTLKQVMDTYGKEGKVAWVYRHFPLESIHPKARKYAEGSECVTKIGGKDKFWAYTDKVIGSASLVEITGLGDVAASIGVDKNAFQACLNGNEFASQITQAGADAIAAGANGTPHTVIIAANGKQFPVSGALPYEQVKQAIDAALAEK